MTTFRRGLTGQVNAPRLRYTLLLRPDNIQTTAVVVGFHCDLISRELARQGVRRGADPALVGMATRAVFIHDRRQFLTAQRYASAGASYGPVSVSVCHKSVFYRNG